MAKTTNKNKMRVYRSKKGGWVERRIGLATSKGQR
jgi:hypothetical protein